MIIQGVIALKQSESTLLVEEQLLAFVNEKTKQKLESLRWGIAMYLFLLSLLQKNKKNNLPGLVDSNSNEAQQVKRNRLWLLTYISLFTSLLSFFILMITLVELGGSTPNRNYQKLVGKIYNEVNYQATLQGLDWLQVENTLKKGGDYLSLQI